MSTLANRVAHLASTSVATLRNTGDKVEGDLYNKDTNLDGFIDLSTAENHIMLPEIAQFIDSHPISGTLRDLTYRNGLWGTKRLRQALANFLNKHFHPCDEVTERDLLLTNGVWTACYLLAFSLVDPGDGILVSQPAFPGLRGKCARMANVRLVYVPFGDIDQFSPMVAVYYEQAILEAKKAGTTVRALLLCHPHNPLGQCYPRNTIIELMKLCNKHKIHLLVDEIFALSVYDVPEAVVPFESVLAIDSSAHIDEFYLHVMYGMSMDFAVPGLRIGCIHTGNGDLWRAISAMSHLHMPGIGNELMASEILEDEGWLENFIATSQKRLAERNKLTRSLLDSKGIPYRKGANAGFFIMADLRRYLDTGREGWVAEQELSKKFFEKKVFVTSGRSMGNEEPGWFRIVFSRDEDVIKEGLSRLFEALGA